MSTSTKVGTALKRVRYCRRVGGVIAAVAAAAISIMASRDPAVVMWAAATLVTSVWPWPLERMRDWEEWAWTNWETRDGLVPKPPLEVPVLQVGEKPPSLLAPFIIRGLLNGSRAMEGFGGPEWLLQPPVADIEVDFFTDASAKTAVVPDGRGRLGDIVTNILSGGTQKLGTQVGALAAIPSRACGESLAHGEGRSAMVLLALTRPPPPSHRTDDFRAVSPPADGARYHRRARAALWFEQLPQGVPWLDAHRARLRWPRLRGRPPDSQCALPD